MERDTYLVLRVTEARRGAGLESLQKYDWRLNTPAAVVAEVDYRVEAQTLDAQDYREARQDREVAAIARPMPLRLIAPVAAAGGAPPDATDHVYGATWGVYVTGALQSPYVGYGVTVAVLDTGIDADHEAFQGVDLVQRDFTGEGNGDQHGHGTHVAGTIFGRTVQGVRYGVAPGVPRALIGKVLGTGRTATTTELVDAVEWAVAEGAHVINMSLGFDFPGLVAWWVNNRSMEVDLATSKALAQYRDNLRLFDKLVELLRARTAHAHSALIIAAAGNESQRHVRPDYAIEVAPPAAAEGIVAVAALGTAGPPHEALSVAPFSNIRATVAAPGVGVYSARVGGGYTRMSGTSMAGPHGAGVAALWAARQIQRRGEVDVGMLEARLRTSARRDRLPGAAYMDVGEGLVTAPTD
jgi:subtilisin family serine protease